MDEISRYAVGLDIGTDNVRAVVASIDKDGGASIVGYNEAQNAGMRKGEVIDLAGPSDAIDRMLGEVERMSGHNIDSAFVSVNGSQLRSTKVDGMIILGPADHEITEEDLARVEDAAISGRLPVNREVLDVIALSYDLDGQSGIKNPLGMIGTRLELRANVISTFAQDCGNIVKTTEGAGVVAERLIPSVVAAAKAVLSDKQMENGVAVIDLGAATTSMAIFEEGDLQYVSVIPVGANNITNDLAIMLKIDIDSAEDMKRRFATGSFLGEKDIVIKIGREEQSFSREEVNSVVKDRLADIFDRVKKELKNAHYDKRLPEGIVLVGGGAKMRDISVFAKDTLEASIKIGVPHDLGGVAEPIEKPDYAAAVGLMMMSVQCGGRTERNIKEKKKSNKGFLKKILKKF